MSRPLTWEEAVSLVELLGRVRRGGGNPPLPRTSAWQIGGGGGRIGERERRGVGRANSESIFVCIVTTRYPAHACNSVVRLCMPYNSSKHSVGY